MLLYRLTWREMVEVGGILTKESGFGLTSDEAMTLHTSFDNGIILYN